MLLEGPGCACFYWQHDISKSCTHSRRDVVVENVQALWYELGLSESSETETLRFKSTKSVRSAKHLFVDVTLHNYLSCCLRKLTWVPYFI